VGFFGNQSGGITVILFGGLIEFVTIKNIGNNIIIAKRKTRIFDIKS
jgi:hypothetical protein